MIGGENRFTLECEVDDEADDDTDRTDTGGVWAVWANRSFACSWN